MNSAFREWNLKLVLKLIDDADQRDLEEYLKIVYHARISQYPNRYIYFDDLDHMLLFQLTYSEYLDDY